MDQELPSEYNFYDLNEDGNVTKLEFIDALEDHHDFEESLFSFIQVDKNGLNFIFKIFV